MSHRKLPAELTHAERALLDQAADEALSEARFDLAANIEDAKRRAAQEWATPTPTTRKADVDRTRRILILVVAASVLMLFLAADVVCHGARESRGDHFGWFGYPSPGVTFGGGTLGGRYGCDGSTGRTALTPLPDASGPSHAGVTLPTSWSYYRGRNGFAVAVPDNWSYWMIGTTTCFSDPRWTMMLSVEQGRAPSTDPVRSLRGESRRLRYAGALPQYTELGIVRVTSLPSAADWEYTFDDAEGARLHVLSRFAITGSSSYLLSWQTRQLDWPTSQDTAQIAFASFHPS
jgi:hypothetical protein